MKRIILFIVLLANYQYVSAQACGSTVDNLTAPIQASVCDDGSDLPSFAVPVASLPDIQIVAEVNGVIATISDDGTFDAALINDGDEACYTAFAYDLVAVQDLLEVASGLCPTLDILFPDSEPCGPIEDLINGVNDGVPGLNSLQEVLDFAGSLAAPINSVDSAIATLNTLNETIGPLNLGEVCFATSGSICLPVINCQDPPPPGDCSDGDILLNGDFETGDYTDWVVSDLYNPFYPINVFCAFGFDTFGFTPIDPLSGSCMAVNGFDGDGPGFISIHQEVTIPADAIVADFTFSWWVAYDLLYFGANLDRIFEMQVQPVGGGVALDIPYSFTAMAGTFEVGSGWINVTVDLSAFAGQTIWACFVETIPESFSGPAQVAIDAVSLNIVCGNICEEDISGGVISSDAMCDVSGINIIVTAPDGTTIIITTDAEGNFTIPGGPYPCGTYTAAFEDINLLPDCYTDAGPTEPITFEVDGDTATSDGPFFIANPLVPTLSQWGLMILALLLMTFGALKMGFQTIGTWGFR